MNIKAFIPMGIDEVTINGLHQWDYGRILEIECAEFGSKIMEIHFSYPGIKSAIPRPCAFADGTGTVAIPDICLEQNNPITAWIYSFDGERGYTVKALTLSVIPRTKPILGHEVPADTVDRYEELLVEVQEAVDELIEGKITAAHALHAESANIAETAASADRATTADTAGTAETADYTATAGTIEMQLVALCTITAGVGTGSVALEVNKPYFLVYKSNTDDTVSSGVMVLNSKFGSGFCPLKLDKAFKVTGGANSFKATIVWGSYLDGVDPNVADTENGTAYIYSFGHIPA